MTIVIPDDLRYTAEHEWVRLADDGTLRIGITDYAQNALGDVVFVDVPDVGATVSVGESIAEVESTKSVSEILAPVDGTVTAVNEALDDAPEHVNDDPYGDGWLYDIEPSDPASFNGLLDADGYADVIGEGP